SFQRVLHRCAGQSLQRDIKSCGHCECAGSFNADSVRDLERLRRDGGPAADHQSDVECADIHSLISEVVPVTEVILFSHLALNLACKGLRIRAICAPATYSGDSRLYT